MKSLPSSIDQVFRKWPSYWPMKPYELVRDNIFVDIQNVADYAWMMSIEKQAIPRIGRCFSPWDNVCVAWHEPTKDSGIAYKLALVTQQMAEDGSAVISGNVMSAESKGGPDTVVCSIFSVYVPPTGTPQEEGGKQQFRMGILGDPRMKLQPGAGDAMFGKGYLAEIEKFAKTQPSWVQQSQIDAQIILCAFSFANCKNISVVEAGRTSPPPKWQKEEGVPTVRYRTIRIGGAPKQRAMSSEGNKSELHMGVHICRGHFKTFTEKAPLLGKHVGTFWWPQFSKGDPKYGEIKKTYEVEPDSNGG